jgi:predicted nuclease of predicted toxin-antitoxin system
LAAGSDHAVWDEACRRAATVITKDEDFVFIGQSSRIAPAPAVVWVRIGNCSRKVLLDAFLAILSTVVELIEAGEKLVEIR